VCIITVLSDVFNFGMYHSAATSDLQKSETKLSHISQKGFIVQKAST
jgi:hypothetical protein